MIDQIFQHSSSHFHTAQHVQGDEQEDPEERQHWDNTPYLLRQHLTAHQVPTTDVKNIFLQSAIVTRNPQFKRYYLGLTGPNGNFPRQTDENKDAIRRNRQVNRAPMFKYNRISEKDVSTKLRAMFPRLLKQFDGIMQDVNQSKPARTKSVTGHNDFFPNISELRHLYRDFLRRPGFKKQYDKRQEAQQALQRLSTEFWQIIKAHPRLSNLFPRKEMQQMTPQQLKQLYKTIIDFPIKQDRNGKFVIS